MKARLGKWFKFSLEDRRSWAGYVFILPWILGFLAFFARPLVQSFLFSIQDVKMADGGFTASFVGFDNYNYMLFKDPTFVRSLYTTAVDVLYEVPIITMFSLFIAVILNQKFRGRTFMRAVFFLPVIIASGVVIVLLKGQVFSNSFSTASNVYLFKMTGLQDLLREAGVSNGIVNYFTSTVNRIFSLTWKSGVQILLFLAGLQTISSSLYEASKMEGASGWDTFWKITLPMISPMIMLNIVYTLIDTFTEYGTENTGNTVMNAIYRTGFIDLLFGYSAAMAWIYFALIGAALALVYFIIGRKIFYAVD
ncbi:ABC-type sugar transport system permease subunit [Paenibacillus taihuensis]|uniref:ABC-type sugar transport system permease subunit n=1 Tax=Paenibacillus taihuensis TaxID=1156355 RepID=A0A3D9Q928_9BACL|nr:sugar ABC transporter permease [Paenibacillus taihuensis]REE56447.1 ABC-type sugar transport system permease subunit [Paenibacillus taihuensis]